MSAPLPGGAVMGITGGMAAQSDPPRILLTRPLLASRRFAADLPKGAGVVISPVLDIVYLPLETPLAPGVGVIFTSQHGVAALARAGGVQTGLAVCVGAATAQAASDAGFDAHSADGDADAVVALIRDRFPDRSFVHVRGRHSRGDVAARLAAAGVPTTERVLYDQITRPLTPQAQSLLSGDQAVLVPLFSPRSARAFTRSCPAAPMAELFCLSPAVAAETQPGLYGDRVVLERPDARAMHAALSRRMGGCALEA